MHEEMSNTTASCAKIGPNAQIGAAGYMDFVDYAETNLERWCYLFGNLNNFAQKPTDPAGFDDVFNLARTGELDGEGLKQYASTMLNKYEKYTEGS